jgi:TolA-binding protein
MSELGAVASFPKKSEVRSHWMKTSLVTLVLAFATFAVAQDAAQQPQAQPAAGQQQAQPAAGQPQKKEIKDPAEYNAYVAAIQQQDNNAKISGLESFLQQYPKSVVREDGMETLMAAYQQAGNQPKVEDTANRLLQLNPNNLRALALKAYLDRAKAEGNVEPQKNLAEGLEL